MNDLQKEALVILRTVSWTSGIVCASKNDQGNVVLYPENAEYVGDMFNCVQKFLINIINSESNKDV